MTTNDKGNSEPKDAEIDKEEPKLDESTDESTEDDEGTKGQEHQEETPEAKRARLQRQLNQHNKKFPVEQKRESEKKPNSDNKSNGLDYGQKAFLIANGIKGNEETSLANKMLSKYDSLEEMVEDKFFQSRLTELREDRAAENARPTGSKRSAQVSRDSVDYWVSKGELPPRDQPALRTKVVQARYNAEKNENVFSGNPVVR